MLLGGFNKKNADVDYAVKCWDQDANLSNTSRLESQWFLWGMCFQRLQGTDRLKEEGGREGKKQMIKYALHFDREVLVDYKLLLSVWHCNCTSRPLQVTCSTHSFQLNISHLKPVKSYSFILLNPALHDRTTAQWCVWSDGWDGWEQSTEHQGSNCRAGEEDGQWPGQHRHHQHPPTLLLLPHQL